MTADQEHPIRLLIVDDEEDLVTFLAHRFRKRGLEVTTALSGRQALAIAEEQSFDVALVDLKMPDIDGIQVMEKLRDTQHHIEIIMLTGHGSHDSAWEAGRLQAYRYLLKPYDFEELYDLIVGAAKHRRQLLQEEFDTRLSELMSSTTSPRDIIEESEKLRREYEQD